MEYVAYLTYQPDNSWQAVIPDLPDCIVNADTRVEALEKVKTLALNLVQQTELVRIELPISKPSTSDSGVQKNGQLDLGALGFGAFKEDSSWGDIFDDIERQRDEHSVGHE